MVAKAVNSENRPRPAGAVLLAHLVVMAVLCASPPSSASELQAPVEHVDLRLGSGDAALDVRLAGWYCTHDAEPLDPARHAKDILESARARAENNDPDPLLRYQLYRYYTDPYFDHYEDQVQGFLQSLVRSPVMRGLNAPPGGTKTHQRRFCYTGPEIRAYVKAVANAANAETRRTYKTMLHLLKMTEEEFLRSRFDYNSRPVPDYQPEPRPHRGHVITISVAREGGENDKSNVSPNTSTRLEKTLAPEGKRKQEAKVGEGPTSPHKQENIVGYWRACNGRIVRFVRQGAQIVGYYTSLGNLGQFGFQPNEESHRLSQAAPGRYTGQIKWRWTDGRMEWRSTTVTVDGDAVKDSGADQCGRRMMRHKTVTGPLNP